MNVETHGNVFIRRIGNARTPKLFCLHGFADSGQMYTPLAGTALAEHFELIAVDLPGCGASPRNPSVNTLEDHARALAGLASTLSPDRAVGLIGHSIASAIAVAMVGALAIPPLGVFSIEGNLTQADAYFSGQAADWDSAGDFKAAFQEEIWRGAQDSTDLRRYFSGVVVADAEALWHLGRDARRVSADDAVGHAYRALMVPTLYYWGMDSTTASTRDFIQQHSLPSTLSTWSMFRNARNMSPRMKSWTRTM